jgi:hypothetical protein
MYASDERMEEGQDQSEGTGEAGTPENPQGTIWPEAEIEKIAPPQRPKREKGNGLMKLAFTKIAQKIKDGFLDLYKDLAEDEPNEKA